MFMAHSSYELLGGEWNYYPDFLSCQDGSSKDGAAHEAEAQKAQARRSPLTVQGFFAACLRFVWTAITLSADASKTCPSDASPSYRCFLTASNNSSARTKGMSPRSR